jgi:hypothetical protein
MLDTQVQGSRPKHAFVLCAGRCGSVTFDKACQHITNFTSGHETRCSELGDERLNFADYHIEVDNRLAWFTGRLQARFGDEPVYVHLTRSPELIAESYNRRWTFYGAISMAYARGILKSRLLGHEPCVDFVRTITENIEYFLSDKSRVFTISIEAPEAGFRAFWEAIGAEGDLQAALKEFNKRYNPSVGEVDTLSQGEIDLATEDEKALYEMQRILRLFETERLDILSELALAKSARTKFYATAEQLGLDRDLLNNYAPETQHVQAGKFISDEFKRFKLEGEKLDAEIEDLQIARDDSILKSKTLQTTIDGLKSARETSDTKIRKAASKIETLETNLVKAKAVRGSLNYKVGSSLLFNLKRPLRWPWIPFSLFRVARQHKKTMQLQASTAKKAQLEAATLATSKSLAVQDAKERTPVKPKLRKHAVNEAWHLGQTNGFDAAEEYILKHGDSVAQHSFELLRANHALADDSAWLKHVNNYLSKFDIQPIKLKEGADARFNRIFVDDCPTVDDGPLVSVIMPAYNASGMVTRAVRSILDQSYRNIELIIVDDQSTDDTWAEIEDIAATDPRVRAIKNAVNTGPYVAKNLALTIAKGEFVTGQDADDWAHPQRIEQQVSVLQKDADVKACLAYMIRMNPDGLFTFFTRLGTMSSDGALRLALISTMFERAFLVENLGFWDSVRFGADSELIHRAQMLLGENFVTYEIVSMLCLDLDTSLTNDPEFGVSRTSGLSDTRRNYKEAWSNWHETGGPQDIYMGFPQTPRKYETPAKMIVPDEDILRSLSAVEETKP